MSVSVLNHSVDVEPNFVDILDHATKLSNVDLDARLEAAAIQSERSEMALCAYLCEVRERNAHREFGYTSVYDYARERFKFGERKTRYLISLGRKIKELPRVRQAMKEGKLGWCKASRLTSVITPQNEGMWLDSALSMTVAELESRIHDGAEAEVTGLHFWLNAEQRGLWEDALEIFRRRAGTEMAPLEAFEYMVAEVIAEWGNDLKPLPLEPAADEGEAGQAPETEHDPPASADTLSTSEPQAESTVPLFPHAEPIDFSSSSLTGEGVQGSSTLFDEHVAKETELAIAFAQNPAYDDLRLLVLERDGWKCTYPGCNERRNLHVHHVKFRSRGGGHEPWNLTVVCEFHHGMIHREEIQVRGRAPFHLDWTPPRLMREALARSRNLPAKEPSGLGRSESATAAPSKAAS